MGLGADVTAWADHVPAFASRWRCVLVDNRGVGRSGQPAGPYSTAQMADDCAEVLKAATGSAAAGVPAAGVPAAVVGISMGGAIAQELALRHPGLVRALVLVSTWARCDGYLAEVFDHLRTTHAVLGPVEFTQLLQLRIWGPALRLVATWTSSERPGGRRPRRPSPTTPSPPRARRASATTPSTGSPVSTSPRW